MKKWLPALNSWKYYLLLAIFAMFVLGPLGAVVGAFMLFSLGFSVGGQVLAGILGSAACGERPLSAPQPAKKKLPHFCFFDIIELGLTILYLYENNAIYRLH